MSSDNPGTVLASTVDSEVMILRTMQESLQKLRTDYQVILGQYTENEMVLEEMKLLEETNTENSNSTNNNIYKMIGPVLIKQSYDDAVTTITKRIEFIRTERDKIETKITKTETDVQKQAEKIQKLQSTLQETTVRAVQAITDQHKRK
jgi:prefoldin beta subunit